MIFKTLENVVYRCIQRNKILIIELNQYYLNTFYELSQKNFSLGKEDFMLCN